MKNLIPIAVIALCVYYYMMTHRPEEPPPPAPAVVVAPAPTPQKLYYHSPLDAPAMPATEHTGAGYYSTDQKSVWKGRTTRDGTAPPSVVVSNRPAQSSTASDTPQ